LVSVSNPAQVYSIATTNELLLEGLVGGVKTGTTVEAGGCLITASTVAGNRVIAVVLGSPVVFDEEGDPTSPARFQDARAILAAVLNDYLWIDPATAATVPGLEQELAAWEAALRPGSAVPVPVARAAELRYRLILGPPGPPNSQVGEVVFFLGSERLATQPVFQAGGGGPGGA
jgi:D-alanyl-D-alanine carboxypeptidase